MSVPTMPFSLMARTYKKIFPTVHKELSYWMERAENIPDAELRKQALASIGDKTFHCEGGAIMALIANEHYQEVIRFIVAYQTISDYLDNLCDRSTSLDPEDFAALHESMQDAFSVNGKTRDYYRFHPEQDDGNYLVDLVTTCQEVITNCEHFHYIEKDCLELCRYYCDLQVHKHVSPDERVPRLENWFAQYKKDIPEMEWYEFSACSGSTLGIFCLISYAFNAGFEAEYVTHIRNGYFPYIQGLHILLDYLIDQEEDRREGDLNFCFYYQDEKQLYKRLKHFIRESDRHTKNLPFKHFHQLINRGMLGLYLSDKKVRRQQNVQKLVFNILFTGGFNSFFFFINAILYRFFQEHKKAGVHAKEKKKMARYV